MMRASMSLLCGVVACGGETAVQLVLAPDPALNSTGEVSARVGRIQVVVDAEGGVAGTGDLRGNVAAVDWDDDGELEAIFTSPVLGDEALPVLEIGLPHNADRELRFTLYGYPEKADLAIDHAIALGGVTSSCDEGERCRVGTPFNLLASQRAPSVVMVLPADGTARVPINLEYVSVVLSTVVIDDTVASGVSLTDPTGVVAVSLQVQEALYGGEGEPQQRRSLVQLEMEGVLREGQHTLVAGEGIIGLNGKAFDQDRSVEGNNVFSSQFVVELEMGGPRGCPVGYEFDDDTEGCIPIPNCVCERGFVCQQSSTDCVEDCRVYRGCVVPGAQCDPETGLCD